MASLHRCPGFKRVIKLKCPVCGSEVPGTVLRSGTFPCPTCKEPIRIRDSSPLLVIPYAACGYSLTFLAAQKIGLKGYGLLIATIFLGCAATFLLGFVVVGLLGWVFRLPPRLERDPGPGSDDGGILHINSPPRLRKPPD